MPDLRGRLLVRHYELCERGPVAQASDHRPVALAATLLLDANAHAALPPHASSSSPYHEGETAACDDDDDDGHASSRHGSSSSSRLFGDHPRPPHLGRSVGPTPIVAVAAAAAAR